jgi:multicomponent K+:H+ antiporter subunit E
MKPTLMKRVFPQPLISAMLFVVWLMLNNTIHPAHLLLGLALAIGIPWVTARTAVSSPRIARWPRIIALGVKVLYDIVKSNIDVGLLILGAESRITPKFVWVPLALRDPHAKAALAGIITMTPGTLSSDFSADGNWLLVHALNVPDEAALIADIKARYEAPLKEIFEPEV